MTKLLDKNIQYEVDHDKKLIEEEKEIYLNKFKELVQGEDKALAKKGLQAIKHMMSREEHNGLGTLYSFDSL